VTDKTHRYEKTVYDERDRTAEVAVYVTRLNQLRVLEHQAAALDSQITFLSTAEDRLKAARCRKQAVADELAFAKMRVDLAEKDVPASILRAINRAQDELGADALQNADLEKLPEVTP
jgi:hypothetical protein